MNIIIQRRPASVQAEPNNMNQMILALAYHVPKVSYSQKDWNEAILTSS